MTAELPFVDDSQQNPDYVDRLRLTLTDWGGDEADRDADRSGQTATTFRPPPEDGPFRVLSLDGGGIRGAFGAAVLAELEARIGGPLTERFDLIAGSSTGAILGCAMAAGIPAADLVTFYRENGGAIFHPRPPFQPRGWLRLFFPAAAAIMRRRTGSNFADFFRARYCPHMLEASLRAGLGHMTMAELSQCRVVVPSVNLSAGRIHIFRTPHLCRTGGHYDSRFEVVDVLRAATAAPTYFPHMVMPDGDSYCDGGLWAISPAVLAITEAMMIMQGCREGDCPPMADLSRIRILSIGTGQSSYSLSPPGGDAGLIYWSSRVADVMSVSQVQGVRPPTDCLLGERQETINFELPDASWRLDRVDLIEDLIELGQQKVAERFDSIAADFLGEPVG